MKFLFSLVIILMASTSCNSSQQTFENSISEKTTNVNETLSGNFMITQIDNKKTTIPKLSIMFDEKSNKVTGFAGCNSFFGTYSANGNSITFSNVATSKKYCSKVIMSTENQIVNALNSATSFTITDKTLSLLENDTTLLKANKTTSTQLINNVISTKSDAVRGNYGTSVKYVTQSRGTYNYVSISKSTIALSKDQSLHSFTNYTCPEKDWKELNMFIEAVNLEMVQKLEAPTDKRSSNGAAAATLSIQIGDILYITPTFDDGAPPKEIEDVVNKVLSIKENAIKK